MRMQNFTKQSQICSIMSVQPIGLLLVKIEAHDYKVIALCNSE